MLAGAEAISRPPENFVASLVIQTPEKVRKLQIALYRKAKADPQWRFWSLYGEICRRDILEHGLQLVARNGGAPGVDGQTIGFITATPDTQQKWLDQLQTELQSKTCRPSPVRRVYIPKSNGGQRPLGIPTVILSVPGQGKALHGRLHRWLKAKGLSLNETKTRIVNFREEGFHFLGYALS